MEILHPATRELHKESDGVGDGNILELFGQYGNAVLQVTGITNATVTFKGSLNGQDWVNLAGYNLTNGTGTATAAANGIYSIPVVGISYFKAEITAYVSGEIDIVANILPVSGEQVSV